MVVINNTGYSSRKVFCLSKFATINHSNARKIWTLNNPIVTSNTNVRMLCSVESCSIPLSYYTINATNNLFKFSGVVGQIPFGNYNANSMAAALNLEQKSFFFTYFPMQSRYVINVNSSKNSIDAIDNNIYRLLGIEVANFSNEYQAPNVCNLVYSTGIYISLNNVENCNIDTGNPNQSSNCLLRIPITQPSNTYLQYFNPVGFKNLLTTSVLNQIDISLLDENRNLLQLTSNVDWTIVLRIDFERVIDETKEVSVINRLRGAGLF